MGSQESLNVFRTIKHTQAVEAERWLANHPVGRAASQRCC